MAIVTAPLLEALRVGFQENFEAGKTKAQPMYEAIATKVPSTSKSSTYGWLGQAPGFREWIGDRVIQSMKEHSYSIVNKDFELTVGVDRNDIEDDNIGVYAPLMTEMGYASEIHPDELVFPLLANGFSELCYDGQFFFDTDHPVFANADGTGAVTSVSNALVEPLYTGPAWYLLDTSRAIKPIIYQERKKAQFTSMTSMTDEAVFTSKQFRYGVDTRENVGFGFWQMAVGVRKELNYDNVWEAIDQMRSFKADGGRPLGLGKTGLTLCVPSPLWRPAKQINERERISDGVTTVDNELQGMFNVISPDFL